MAEHGPMQLLRGTDTLATDGVVLEVIPDALIRIEFRRIRREEEQTETILDGLDELRHAAGFVSRMTIDNQKRHAICAMNQPLDKIKELRCADPPLNHHEAKFTLGTDRRDHVQTKPCTGAADHRGSALCRPGGTGVMIGTHPASSPKNICALRRFARALIFGYSCPSQRSTSSDFC